MLRGLLPFTINREYLEDEDDINGGESSFNRVRNGVSAAKMGMGVVAMLCG